MHVSDASMRNNRISAPEFLNRYCALATLDQAYIDRERFAANEPGRDA
jgi:hypothetical protein